VTSVARQLPTTAPRDLEQLDDHQIVARIGRGGMAEIFLARRPAPPGHELVVLKRLHPDDADDPVILRMFLDEARLALRLTHRSIVRGLGLGIFEDRHALVLEFLEGQPLQALLRRVGDAGRVLPLEVVVPAFADVLEGLHYAHELEDETGRALNVVHRDVSPHNLFVTSVGELKVLDFGIAKTAIQENRTRTGLLKGKVAYMAPEQAHGANVDRRADVWSLGVTLWETLVGARLFRADNEAASLRLTLSGPVARPSTLRAEIPGEIDAIVMRALQRDPLQRYATASAMAEDLRAFARRRNLPASAPLRDVMDEIFGQDLVDQRQRITSLVSGDAVPISSSVPALIRPIGAPESVGRTRVSTMTEFLGKVEPAPRRGRGWAAPLLAFLLTGIIVGAFMLGARRASSSMPVEPPQQPTTPATAAVAPQPAPAAPAAAPEPATRAAGEPAESATAAAEPATTASKHRTHKTREGDADETDAPRRSTSEVSKPTLAPSAAPDGEFGYLTLDTTPWSQVSADGAALGQTPIVRARLRAGPHTLVLSNSERGVSTTYQVTVEPGKTSVKRLGLE